MARSPTQRRSFSEESTELNLVPMMNLIGMLIPVLLMSAAFIEIAVINVSMPAIGPSSGSEQKDDNPPLNLRVTITQYGYEVSDSLGVIPVSSNKKAGPNIPLVLRKINCGPYVNTVPPPRSRNQSSAICKSPSETPQFWVYDAQALTKLLLGLKNKFPHERRIIIAGEADTEYDAVVEVMDASREARGDDGSVISMFDEVVLGPPTS